MRERTHHPSDVSVARLLPSLGQSSSRRGAWIQGLGCRLLGGCGLLSSRLDFINTLTPRP